MPLSITILFFVVSSAMLLWNLFKTKGWKGTPSAILPALKTGLLIALPFMALYGAAKFADFGAAYGVWSFAFGVMAPCLVARMIPGPLHRSLVLLIISVLAYYVIPDHNLYQIESLLAGIIAWKCADNLLTQNEKQMEDVLPAVIWLSVLCWTSGGDTSAATIAQQQGMVLGSITVALVLKWLGDLLSPGDKFYVKRVALSTLGGVCVLGVIAKMIVVGHLDKMAILAGAGFLCAYLLDSIDKQQDEAVVLTKPLKQLILVGIYTLAATRLFDTLGTLLLASTMIAAPKSRGARMAGLFWCGKALAQEFLIKYNPNVTGINLTHTYTTAALYAGFLALIFLLVCLRDIEQNKSQAIAFLTTVTVAPIAAAFFLHSEPTSSFLVAATVAGVMLATSADCLFGIVSERADTIILAPLMLALVAILSNEVLLKGDESSSEQKLIVVGVMAFVLLAVTLIQKVFGGNTIKTRLETVSQD